MTYISEHDQYENFFKNDFDNNDFYPEEFSLVKEGKNDNEYYRVFMNQNTNNDSDSNKEIGLNEVDTQGSSDKGEKNKIFEIEKNPKISKKMKIKTERAKQMLSQKTDRDRNNQNNTDIKINEEQFYFIVDNKVYVTKDNLTPDEKKQIKKIQNRISAQKSRDEQKLLIENLKNRNAELEKKIISYEKIMSECNFCSSKVSHLSQSINPTIATSGSFTGSNYFLFGTSSLVILTLITISCIFGFFKSGIQVRKLTEVNYNEHSLIPYRKNETKKGTFLHRSNNLKLDYEYYGVQYCLNKMEPENEFFEEYLDAKIGKDLNFTSIYEDNPKCFNFRMIIPCEFNSTSTNKSMNPIIGIENSEYYQSMMQKYKNIPYYEVHCKIYDLYKFENEQCSNSFK